MANRIKGITVEINGDTIVCGAGASLRSVCIAAQKASLSGLEFAYGIPGTVGGALYMNAGAYGGEMSQVVASATAVDADGNEVKLELSDMKLGYRTSVFKNSNLTITSITMKLQKGDCTEIKNAMDDFFSRRRDKQPLEYPSAGSVFKRSPGRYTGQMIEEAGLKGYTIGGAQVSEKHAGFIINRGNATAADVLALIEHIKTVILERFGCELECEMIYVK